MRKDNGGPAFPIPLNPGSSYQGHGGEVDGMTLRDYFAAKAMAGILCNEFMVQRHRDAAKDNYIGEDDLLATSAFAIADAMIAERAK